MKKQSQNMVRKNDSTFFLQPTSYQKYIGEPEFHVLPGENNSSGVPNRSLDFLKKFGHLLISCSVPPMGWFVAEKQAKIPLTISYLFATRQLKGGFPSPAHRDFRTQIRIPTLCNMGPSDKFPSDYFLMAVQDTENWSPDLKCKIFSPAEGIWQERGLINLGARRILFKSHIYQKGVFYLSDWFPYLGRESPFHWPYINEFDPEKGTSNFLQIPKPRKSMISPI